MKLEECKTAEDCMNWYLANDAKELKKISKQILRRDDFRSSWNWLNLSQKDEDDFYSIANEVLWDITKRWDGERAFRGLLDKSLQNKFDSEFRKRGAQKREKDRDAVSLESMLTEDGGELEDILDSGFSIENEIQKNGLDKGFSSKGVIQYIKSLSSKQKQLLTLQMEGYSAADIKQQMNLTEKNYQGLKNSLKDYELISKLYACRKNPVTRKGDDYMRRLENSKNGVKEIRTLCRMLDIEDLRCDHPMQRPSGQWSNIARSEFISDLLQGNAMLPIVISEENLGDGRTILWVIDGVQRCSVTNAFINDGFKISSSVQIYEIKYEAKETGEIKRDKNGCPIREVKTFDIRNKKFSQFPKELQEDLLNFEYPTLLNLNCTKEKIAYDIARLNRSRPMNGAQTGWTGLEETMAITIKRMIRNMNFFSPDSDINSFKRGDLKNGQLQKMVVETLMTINFPDSYTSDFKKNCKFLAQHAEDWVTTNFFGLVSDLEAVLTADVSDLFTTTKTVLWLTLFNKFKEIEVGGSKLDDYRFVDFLRAFKDRLYAKEVDGESLESIGTNDSHRKGKLQRKMNVLLNLMWEYFEVTPSEEPVPEEEQEENLHNEPEIEAQEAEITEGENTTTPTAEEKSSQPNGEEHSEAVESFEEPPTEKIDIKKFCEEVLQKEVLDEDIDLWKACLEDSAAKMEISPDTPHLKEENMPSLIALTAWIYDKDKDDYFEEWLRDYFEHTNNYEKNQRENFRKMRTDFCMFEGFYARKEAS